MALTFQTVEISSRSVSKVPKEFREDHISDQGKNMVVNNED